MNDIIEQEAYPAPAEPNQATNCQTSDWQMGDDARVATLSHFGAPYIEGDTPLFI